MDRRTILRTAGAATCGLVLDRALPFQGREAARASGPTIKNILLLMTDQHRVDSVGCYKADAVKTPHIDGLAAEGIRFTHAFTPTAVCTPARTSLQSGLFAHRHGLIFNPEYYSHCGGLLDPRPQVSFFSQSLKNRGWNLANVGKWHIGSAANRPAARGYEGIDYPGYGFPGQPGDPARTHPDYLSYLRRLGVNGFEVSSEIRSPDKSRVFAGIQEGPEEASEAAYLAAQTIDTIRRFGRDGRPFFIACNFWGPHTPFYIPERYSRMYERDAIEPWPNFDCSLEDKPEVIRRYGKYWKTEWFNRDILADLIARYYGYITLIDDQVGRILEALRDSGEAERTLIVFSADHGDTAGAYHMWDKGFGMYDCITRIPLVISHPALKPAVSDSFVTLLDLAPTFLEIGGCPVPETLDGRSLVPLLRGMEEKPRNDFVITEHFGHQMPFWQRMVRTREAKYIHNPTDRDEFYDLVNDPWETKNIIAAADPKRVAGMKDRLREWIARTDDPLGFWSRQLI